MRGRRNALRYPRSVQVPHLALQLLVARKDSELLSCVQFVDQPGEVDTA